MSDIAHFPISGPVENPVAGDYENEAQLLRAEGAAGRRHGRDGDSARYYELGRAFSKTARRKRWAEQQAERRNGSEAAA